MLGSQNHFTCFHTTISPLYSSETFLSIFHASDEEENFSSWSSSLVLIAGELCFLTIGEVLASNA